MSKKWADSTVGRLDVERAVAESLGKPVQEVAQVFQAALNVMAEALVSGKRVELRRFGNLRVVERKARRAYNPRTGGTMAVAAKRVIKFSAGRQLAEAVIEEGAA